MLKEKTGSASSLLENDVRPCNIFPTFLESWKSTRQSSVLHSFGLDFTGRKADLLIWLKGGTLT